MTIRQVIGLIALLIPGLAACVPMSERGEHVVIEPAYVFSIGVHKDDVIAMLGWPTVGPRYDELTRGYELVYIYPIPVIQAETRFSNGTTRAEMVDTIHLFFSRAGLLTNMGSRTNRWYSSVIEQQVQRVTVMPRVIHSNGMITAPRPRPAEAPAPANPAPAPPGLALETGGQR